MAVERFVPIDAWPATVQRACYARLRALMSVEVVEPAAIHTPECRVHVITEHPNCANQWDASCEDATAVFYSQGNQARLGPWLTVNCHAAICAVQPSCCDYIWDSSCEVLATLNCTLAPGFGCNWSGQPYPYDWRYLGYCGASGGATFPVACFNECCFEHDLCYGVCGMRPGETNLRLGCDETLLECALSKCLTGAAGYNPPLSACPAPLENCAAAAYVFYNAIRLGVRTRGVYATRGTRLLFLLVPGGPSCVNLMTFFVTQGIEKLDPPVSAIG